MKGTQTTEPMPFKDAIIIFLKTCKTSDKIVKEFIATEDGE